VKKLVAVILLIAVVGGLTGCPPTQTIMRAEKKDEGLRKGDAAPQNKAP
jgi:hypothetical protein